MYRELRAKFKTLARLMEGEEYEKFITSLKSELIVRDFPHPALMMS